MSPVLRSALLSVLALLGLGSPAAADTALRLDTAQLVARSELILEGRVRAVRSRLEPDGAITTEYELSVARSWMGQHRAVRAFRVPGGVLPDGRGLLFPGLPRWKVGDEVVLFLTRRGRTGLRVPVGASQGSFHLARDADGELRVSRRLAGLRRVPGIGAPDAEPERATESARRYASWEVELEAAIEAELARRARARAAGRSEGARDRDEEELEGR